VGAPCFMSAINSFTTSATLKTRQSGKHLTYSEQMRSVSSKSPKTSLPLKRTSTMASSSTQSSRRPASKVDIGNVSSVKPPAKKSKNVLQSDFEKMLPTELPVIVIPDNKTRAPKISLAKLVSGQEEESAVVTLLRVQMDSLLEKDSKRDDKALEAQRKLAHENEQLRKELEAVKLKAQFDMRKNEDEAKERERELVEKVERERQEVNAIAERLREETQRREEKEREERRKKESDDALFKVKEELEAKAKREMDELKAKQEEEKVIMRRELDESNRKRVEELEMASKELIEKEEAIQRVERQKDEAMKQREKEYEETILQLKQEIAAKKAMKREKKLLKMAQLLESQKDEKRDKENQETQRLRNLKDELKITADYELQQVQILQMRDELKEKERRRQQNNDDEHQKQRTSNEVMRRMALVNVGKAEYDLDVQRKNLFDKN